jgi:hypothetical protein
MSKTKHDKIAERIARKLGAEYNPKKGPDVITAREVDEVELNRNNLKEGMSQVRGYRQLKYIVVPKAIEEEAIEATKGTKIGVRNEAGKIIKPANKR